MNQTQRNYDISEDIVNICKLLHSTTSPYGTDEVLSVYEINGVIIVEYYSEFDGCVMYTPYVGKYRYVTSYPTEQKAIDLGLAMQSII